MPHCCFQLCLASLRFCPAAPKANYCSQRLLIFPLQGCLCCYHVSTRAFFCTTSCHRHWGIIHILKLIKVYVTLLYKNITWEGMLLLNLYTATLWLKARGLSNSIPNYSQHSSRSSMWCQSIDTVCPAFTLSLNKYFFFFFTSHKMAIRGEKKKGCSFLLLLNVSEEELLPVSSIFLRAIPASLTTDLLQNSSCNFGKSVQISRMGTMLTFIIFSFTCQKTGEGR